MNHLRFNVLPGYILDCQTFLWSCIIVFLISLLFPSPSSTRSSEVLITKTLVKHVRLHLIDPQDIMKVGLKLLTLFMLSSKAVAIIFATLRNKMCVHVHVPTCTCVMD